MGMALAQACACEPRDALDATVVPDASSDVHPPACRPSAGATLEGGLRECGLCVIAGERVLSTNAIPSNGTVPVVGGMLFYSGDRFFAVRDDGSAVSIPAPAVSGDLVRIVQIPGDQSHVWMIVARTDGASGEALLLGVDAHMVEVVARAAIFQSVAWVSARDGSLLINTVSRGDAGATLYSQRLRLAGSALDVLTVEIDTTHGIAGWTDSSRAWANADGTVSALIAAGNTAQVRTFNTELVETALPIVLDPRATAGRWATVAGRPDIAVLGVHAVASGPYIVWTGSETSRGAAPGSEIFVQQLPADGVAVPEAPGVIVNADALLTLAETSGPGALVSYGASGDTQLAIQWNNGFFADPSGHLWGQIISVGPTVRLAHAVDLGLGREMLPPPPSLRHVDPGSFRVDRNAQTFGIYTDFDLAMARSGDPGFAATFRVERILDDFSLGWSVPIRVANCPRMDESLRGFAADADSGAWVFWQEAQQDRNGAQWQILKVERIDATGAPSWGDAS